MTVTPLSVAKAAMAAVAPLATFVREQMALRDVDNRLVDQADFGPRMDSALQILTGDASTLAATMVTLVKQALASPPSFLSEEPVRSFLRTENAQGFIKAAVRVDILRQDRCTLEADAGVFYASFDGADGPGLGIAAFEYAVSFVTAYLLQGINARDQIVLARLDVIGGQIVDAQAPLPQAELDIFIAAAVERLRKARFFTEFDRESLTKELGEKLASGVYSRGSPSVRGPALAAVARFGALTLQATEIENWIAIAAALASSEDAEIAAAFLTVAGGTLADGLARLKPIDTPTKRTAALQLVRNLQDGPAMFRWAREACIAPDTVDSDGRLIWLGNLLAEKEWDAAHTLALAISEADLKRTPGLILHVARARLVGAVTAAELKALVAVSQPITTGELARMRVLADWPPFQRRLAVFAHAALLVRILLANPPHSDFANWASAMRARHFYFQGAVDLQLEPRWHPEGIAPNNLRAELLGRIHNAATREGVSIPPGRLRDLLLGTEAESLSAHIMFPESFGPGPLEGCDTEAPAEMPAEFAEVLDGALAAEQFTPTSVIGLINLKGLFPLSSEHVERAVTLMRQNGHRFAAETAHADREPLFIGLAGVAAVTRAPELANELRTMVRKNRIDGESPPAVQRELLICLTAAGAFRDRAAWAEFVGNWCDELAFGLTDKTLADGLLDDLYLLCALAPELRRFLSPAIAAAAGFAASP